MTNLDAAARRSLDHEFDIIRDEYRGVVDADVVERCLQRSLDWLMAEPRVNSFVPLLARRHAKQELRAIAGNAAASETRGGYQDERRPRS